MAGRVPSAGDAFRRLSGLICVHKPAGYSMNKCMNIVRHKLTVDLNEVAQHQVAAPAVPAVAGADQNGSAPSLCAPDVAAVPREAVGPGSALALHGVGGQLAEPPDAAALDRRLVTGPAFLPPDIRLSALAALGRHTSGPFVLGINDGTRLIDALRVAGPQLRVHQLTARLGVATDTLLADGRATDRATYGHVTRGRLEALLSGLQAAHQRHMYEHTGLSITSQAAYELAVRGLPRPERGSPPVLYALRCVQFAPPFFTVEVHGVNDTEQYLLTLVHDLGRQLRSAATTVRASCLRHGPFTLEHALLMKHWRLAHVRQNLRQCQTVAGGIQVSGTLEPLVPGETVRPAGPGRDWPSMPGAATARTPARSATAADAAP